SDAPHWTPLAGGVSSDIWRVDAGDNAYCVKCALPKLKVDADWRAPIERNGYEVAWMEVARGLAPGSAPPVLHHDPEEGLFVMPFFDPAQYRLWKDELREGRAEPDFAATVGRSLSAIHNGTADDDFVMERFQTNEIFHAIRLEPYLEATARSHPDLAEELAELVRVTASTKRVLVHGDVSPKNIMVGPDGPVFLDAECAWYGDPAFDLAFCLNHLLLKCLMNPDAAPRFLACYNAMAKAYMDDVRWEPRSAIESRTAHLLPGLLLARVDGKSPVEYLEDAKDKSGVRRVARSLLFFPVERLADVRDAWAEEIGV
ncbi:MAG: phosphotransferase, partial [Rhodospirillales bacterium]|nr:phosphotransferase [Rhodospirillales bacterium]